MNDDMIIDVLKEMSRILKDEQILLDVPMKEHTSMRVGGKANMLDFLQVLQRFGK